MSNLFYLDFNRVIHLKAEIAEDRSEEVLKQVLRLPGIHFACIGIAQVITEDPEFLITDEPMNRLDKNGVREMHGLLKGCLESVKQ